MSSFTYTLIMVIAWVLVAHFVSFNGALFGALGMIYVAILRQSNE